MNRFKLNIRFFKLTYINILANKYTSLMTFFITTILIAILFSLNLVFLNGKQILSDISSGNFIVINSEMVNNEDKLSIDTIDRLLSETKDIKTISLTYNFFFKIPTSLKINYADIVKLDTDIFLMAYDFDYLKKHKFKKIHDDIPDSVGLILSSKALYLLSNTVIKNITVDTVGFLKGDIIFGKSSLGQSEKIFKKPFFIEGVSDDLPVYSLAIDTKLAYGVMDYLGINKESVRIHEITVNYTNESDLIKIKGVIKGLENERKSKYVVKNVSEENELLKNKYIGIGNILGYTFLIFVVSMMIFIFYLKIMLLIEKNRKTIKTLGYLGLSDFLITNIYFLEYAVIFIFSFFVTYILSKASYLGAEKIVGNQIMGLTGISDFRLEMYYNVLIFELIGILIFIYLLLIFSTKKSRFATIK